MPTHVSANAGEVRRPRILGQRADAQRRPRTGIAALVVLTAGAYLPSPLYPLYQQAFELSDLSMTLVYATFALVSAPALVLFGPAADAVGSRFVLRVSLVVAAIGSACFAFAVDPLIMVAGRAAQGLALGLATGAAGAVISEMRERTSRPRGRVNGAVQSSIAFVAGTAVGPTLAGVLATWLPAPRTLPFVVHLVVLAVVWRAAAVLDVCTVPARRWTPRWPAIPPGMRLRFATAAGSGFVAWTVAGIFLAVIPTLLARSGQTNLALVGVVLGTVLVCSALIQPLIGRLGVRRAQLSGLTLLLISLGILALTASGATGPAVVAALIAGAGHGLTYGGAAAAVDMITPDGKRGGVIGALYLTFYLGCGCPAVIIGLVTLAHPLATATTWVTATTAAVVPLVAVAVGYVGARAGDAPGLPRERASA